MQSKMQRVVFSGKDEDWDVFAEQFEARMHSLKLRKALLGDFGVRPEVLEQGDAFDEGVEEAKYSVWCELIQCLDRKSILQLRVYKGDGPKAWAVLREKFKISEKPRIH